MVKLQFATAGDDQQLAGMALGEYLTAERLSRQAIALGRALYIPLYLCEYLHNTAERRILPALH